MRVSTGMCVMWMCIGVCECVSVCTNVSACVHLCVLMGMFRVKKATNTC